MPVPTLTLQRPTRLFEQQGVSYWRGWAEVAALCPLARGRLMAAGHQGLLEVFVKEIVSGPVDSGPVDRGGAVRQGHSLAPCWPASTFCTNTSSPGNTVAAYSGFSYFEHEYLVMCQMQHPGVSKVVACTPTQLCFEWLPGDTLREYLTAHGPLSALQAAELLRVLLDVLTYLHALGIVHHDIKPENVMLPPHWPQPLAGEWGVILLDFGMSFSAALPDIHAWARMGTPHYMAPEQFQGVRGDPRSDLFSVGALLFDMLSASPPHPDALGWLAGYNPAAPPLPAPAAFQPLLRSALQRDPALRPQSAQQMLQMLDTACGEL